MTTPLSSMALVLAASFIGSFGAATLKHGANRLGSSVLDVFLSWRIVLGIALFLLSSVFYLLGLKHGSLTVLYPLVSLGYIWTLLWSRLFFREPFNRSKILGLFLILIGVLFIGLGNR